MVRNLKRSISRVLLACRPSALVTAAMIFAAAPAAKGQGELDVMQIRNMTWLSHSDITNSLYRHITGEAYEMLGIRAKEIAAVSSADEWQQKQKQIKDILHEITGPFPEKTPLNANITGTVIRDGYRVENIIFESRPGFFVTSSLFIPDMVKGQTAPAIVYCSGHTAEGYRSSAYQHKIINLVKKGFIVFAFDPVGQGERMEYYHPETGISAVGGPTIEHSWPGAQAFITGGSLAGYMIWDGIRAVDYLFTRPEVDTMRIGITGRSGGGTQSAYIAALDERVYASAPEAYITSFARLLESIGPQDAEQNLFNGIMHGIDHADFLAVRAPKPTLIISTLNDFFSIHGARETYSEVQRIYKAKGKPENLSMAEDIGGHTSTRRNREAMYAFFQEHLGNPGDPSDMEVDILSEAELRVTSTGQLSSYSGSETIFSLNRKVSEDLQIRLERSRNECDDHLKKAVASAMKLSGYRTPDGCKNPVYTGRVLRDGYRIEKYFTRGEGDYVIPFLLMIPDNPSGKSVIYLHPEGKAVAAGEGSKAEWLVSRGFTVLIPDLIGIGETGPGYFRGDAFIEGISYNVWFASILTGRSITGIRASDVVKLTCMLYKHHGYEEVYALAIAEMSSVLLHAAAFEPSISRLALLDPLSSYHSLVTKQFYSPQFIHGAVPGMLEFYDLPDLAASLAPRLLMLSNAVDGTGEPGDRESINRDLSVIRNAYRNMDSYDSLIIDTGTDLNQFFKKWIK